MTAFNVSLANGDRQSVRWETVDALVDTGSTYTWVSRDILQRLGISPEFAREFETADGRILSRELQITLKLRQGVKWHNKPPVNGRALEMEDVLFSWDRFSRKSTARVNVANAVNPDAPVLSLTAADSKTIVMKLKEPLVDALGLFIGTNGTGVYIIPKETDTTLDLRGDQLGTGAWVLTNYTPSVGYTLKRNAEFYDKDWALMDQIDMPIISEYATALAQLKAGNIYVFGQTGAGVIRAEDILPVKREEPRLSIYQGDLATAGSTQSFGWLPEGKSPFLDERVRQAVSMAIDRDLYLDTVLNVSGFEREGLPVATRWSTSLAATLEGWWLDPKGKDFGSNAKYYQHDLAEAKKLLAAAGYPRGFETISSAPGQELPSAAFGVLTDGMIAEAGITSTPNRLDYLKEYIPNYRDGKGQYEGWGYMSTAGGNTGPSALSKLTAEYWSQGGAAFHGFSVSGKNDKSGDPQVDAMIVKARVEQDTEKRRTLVFDIQRYLAKALYALSSPGAATGFVLGWPCLGNFRVWRGARDNYRWWIDDTKPPFKGA